MNFNLIANENSDALKVETKAYILNQISNNEIAYQSYDRIINSFESFDIEPDYIKKNFFRQ